MSSLKTNVVLNFLNTVTGIIFPVITFPYAARVLLPEGIGAVNFLQSIVAYIVLSTSLGIPMYAVREVAKYRDDVAIRNRITLPEFNERQEGVANWFKQVGSLDLKAPMEFPEGYYSIKDSMEDLSKNEEALALATRAVKLATNFDIKPGVGMWDMMKRMTPEAMAKMINMPDGFIESLNAQLIKIKK